MIRILFQGDSITDAGRREDLGLGYPNLVAARLGFDHPGEYEFFNRGISGNRIVDLYARIKKDIIHLQPDYISILIGVNDVWHELNYKNGICSEKFEMLYKMLIEEIKEALPKAKIMILEPFLLPESATVGTLDDGTDKYTRFKAEVEKNAQIAKRIAETYGLVFVPMQAGLNQLCEIQPAAYWLKDGVHPSFAGHEFIARKWVESFQTL